MILYLNRKNKNLSQSNQNSSFIVRNKFKRKLMKMTRMTKKSKMKIVKVETSMILIFKKKSRKNKVLKMKMTTKVMMIQCLAVKILKTLRQDKKLNKNKKELLNQFLRIELSSLIETLIRFSFSFISNFFCNKVIVASIAVDVM